MRSVLLRVLVLLSLVSLAVPAAVGSASALPELRSAPTARAVTAQTADATIAAEVSTATPAEQVLPVELVDERTAKTRTFLLPDGTRRMEIFTGPVHYRAGSRWEAIDNTLVASDRERFAVQNRAGGYRLLLPQDAGSAPVRVEADGAWVSFAAAGVDGAPQVRANTATLAGGLGPDTRLEYAALNQGVKETIVLSAPPVAPPVYTFEVQTSPELTPALTGDGGLEFTDASGEVVFASPAPFMTDSAEPEPAFSDAVTYALVRAGEAWTLTLTPDPGWLTDPARVYPVAVDPTLTIRPAEKDTWISAHGPNTSHGGGQYLQVGASTDEPRRALVQFDLSTLPANGTVSSALFALNIDAAQSPNHLLASYLARRLTRSWTTGATWNSADGSGDPGAAWTGAGEYAVGGNSIEINGSSNGYREWDVTSIVDTWESDPGTNFGLLVKQASPENVNNLISFYSSNHAEASTRGPKLVVDYTEPTPPAASQAGDRDYYTFVTEQLTDKMSAKVNVANGNLLVTANDTQVPGIAGLDLVLTRFYNSALATTADPSKLGGGGWSTGLAGSVRLTFPNSDGDRVFFHDVSGHRVRFERSATGSFIRHAPGLDANLERPGGSGNYRLEWYSKDVWLFNDDGQLIEMQDSQGNTITFTHDTQGRVQQATDTRGRTAVFSYRSGDGMLDHVDINAADGTRLLTYSYGYTSDQPVRLATSELSFVNTTLLGADTVNVGAETRYFYSADADRRLVRIEDARETATGQGGVTTIGYHASGRVQNLIRHIASTADNPYSQSQTSFVYDDTAPTAAACNGQGTTSTVVNGERTDVTDTTTYCPDQHGRVERTVDARGNARKSTWTDNSNVQTFDGSGTGQSTNPFIYTYDESDNLTEVEQPNDGTARMSYGDTGTNPHLPTAVRDFAAGKDAPVATWLYEYDDNGLLIEARAPDPNVNITYRYCWDGDGQLQRISPSNADGSNSVDPLDTNLTAGCGTASQGNDTLLSYDADGQLTNVNPPGVTQGRSYTYDRLSRVKTMTDGRGVRATFTYDALDHVVKTVHADDPAVPGVATDEVTTLEWEYDQAGNLIGRIDAGGSSTFTVDELNRRTFEPKTHAQDPLNGITYRYDAADNLIELEPAQLEPTTYAYNEVNLVTSVNDPRTDIARATTFGYDNKDNRTRTTYPMADGNDLVQAAAFDNSGNMKCIYSYRESNDPNVPADTCPSATAAGLITFFDYDYHVGGTGAGNSTNTVYRVTELGGRDTNYTYDTITRLTEAVTGSATSPVRKFVYTYDKRSNLTRERVSGSMGALDTRTTSIAYDDAEQMCWALRSTSSPATDCASQPTGATAFDYDGAGSMLDGTGGELDGLALAYNAVGQTTSISGVAPDGTTGTVGGMAYSGATQDVRFSASLSDGATLRYSHNLLGLSMQATSSGGPHEETFVRDPAGALVAMIDVNAGELDRYYLTDHLGSVISTVNTAGSVRRYIYEPYGEQLRNFIDEDAGTPTSDLDGTGADPKDTAADFNPYRYASGYFDRSTGMLKFGTRYYMPTLGRWTQTDPVAGQPNDPMTFNPYLYVGADPTNSTDSTGRDSSWDLWKKFIRWGWGAGGSICYIGTALQDADGSLEDELGDINECYNVFYFVMHPPELD